MGGKQPWESMCSPSRRIGKLGFQLPDDFDVEYKIFPNATKTETEILYHPRQFKRSRACSIP